MLMRRLLSILWVLLIVSIKFFKFQLKTPTGDQKFSKWARMNDAISSQSEFKQESGSSKTSARDQVLMSVLGLVKHARYIVNLRQSRRQIITIASITIVYGVELRLRLQ